MTPGADQQTNLDSLDRIRASVDLCKDLLSAYAEVAKVRARLGPWPSSSLRESLQAAAKVYSDTSNVLVELPNAIAGYTNHFLLATLLPILENALDESEEGWPVGVVASEDTNSTIIEITNQTLRESLDRAIYTSGMTTKSGHQGLGLSGVRRLLDTRGGAIGHTCENGWITFEVRLPKEAVTGASISGMTTSMPPTLEMVAAAAGVSRATVSRVINGSTNVRPQVVAAVNEAIIRLNYVPNK
ncbi:hypothetical protein GCM10022236_42860 [Microlunatus ginsengisoli]|uniref:HTH lacI-type domain-containing protein n=2 Tax=Microlunatus ginsengisoli TaxID=363863 RepID=A0ABP7AN84_9ACTN